MTYLGEGFLSNVPDLAKFGNSFLHEKLLSKEIIEAYMWNPTTLENGRKINQGVGFRIYSNGIKTLMSANFEIEEGRRIVGHGGDAGLL